MQIPEGLLLKLFLSILVGGIIGAEREYRSKSAGFRTLTLICMGAMLFTLFSELIGLKGTPDRIASNIVVGIGFVGAGVIFKYETGVQGITTAAMIWVTAALGMGIGAGYYLVSVCACILTMLVLFLFSKLEKGIDRINQIRNYKIVYEYENDTLHRFEERFEDCKLRFKRGKQTKEANEITGEWVAQGPEKNHRQFIYTVLSDVRVKSFEF
jgi:putative Mg2+ transporter-C (MgtC) family protein